MRVFFAPASMGLAPLPAGLLADPFGWNPAGASVWTPISISAANVGRIEPGRPILREVKRGAEIVLGETDLDRGKPARLFVPCIRQSGTANRSATFPRRSFDSFKTCRPVRP